MQNNPFLETQKPSASLGTVEELEAFRKGQPPGAPRSSGAWVAIAAVGALLEFIGAVVWLLADNLPAVSKGQVTMLLGLSLLVVAGLVQGVRAPWPA